MSKVKIIIRTDASIQIGSGHLMRCLTLAEALRESGAKVQFICSGHSGNLIELIRRKKFIVRKLPAPDTQQSKSVSGADTKNDYNHWLGTSQEQDAFKTIKAFQAKRPDWLIVDHYALRQIWETLLRPHVRKIMVIDDLADRPHDCDVLLNQNYLLESETRYEGLLPPTCTKLLGPQYALLRSEFAEARKHLKSRTGKVQRVFVFFGGTDTDNVTGKTLEALSFPEFSHLDVDVVIGAYNPHRTKIEQQVKTRLRTTLHVQVDNIAEFMGKADLAIGAGGGTTWERLCLGLPSLVVTIAENQTPFTKYLHQDGYLTWLGTHDTLEVKELRQALRDSVEKDSINRLQSQKGMEIVQGDGVYQVNSVLMHGIPSDS